MNTVLFKMSVYNRLQEKSVTRFKLLLRIKVGNYWHCLLTKLYRTCKTKKNITASAFCLRGIAVTLSTFDQSDNSQSWEVFNSCTLHDQ